VLWWANAYPNVCFFGYMPRNDIIGSYGNSIFSFLRNLHTVYHSGCINLHSHQQCIRVPVLPHHHKHLLLLLSLNKAILTGVRWNLNVVRKVEHFFVYLLAICTSSFENALFNLYAYFFIGMLILCGFLAPFFLLEMWNLMSQDF
jgi:hypothetical protein